MVKERLQNLVELGDKEGIERQVKRDDIDEDGYMSEMLRLID